MAPLGVFARHDTQEEGAPSRGDPVNTNAFLARARGICGGRRRNFGVVWPQRIPTAGETSPWSRRRGRPDRLYRGEHVHPRRRAVRRSPAIAATSTVADQQRRVLRSYGRRFTSAGVPVGGEFAVNLETNLHQQNPSIGVDPAGALRGDLAVELQLRWIGSWHHGAAVLERWCRIGGEYRCECFRGFADPARGRSRARR